MFAIGSQIFSEKFASVGASGQSVVIAVEAAPFSEMVCYVKGCGGGCGILIIDEIDSHVFGGGDSDDNVAAEKVAMGENVIAAIQAGRLTQV